MVGRSVGYEDEHEDDMVGGDMHEQAIPSYQLMHIGRKQETGNLKLMTVELKKSIGRGLES
jgi:hypothetical protein